MKMEATPCVKAVILAATQYRNNKTDTNMVYLQRQLDVLVGITTKRSVLKYFTPHNLLPTECITVIVDILQDQKTKQSLALKCLMLLQNLVADNEIRESLQRLFNLTPVLAGIIKLHDGSVVDSLTVECVDLLQKVTYGYKISYEENYVEDLLLFVIKQIMGQVNELKKPCLGLLANICRDNFAVQSYIRNLDNYKSLCKSVMANLTGEKNDLMLVVFSLSIISSICLNEGIGDKLFQKKNINQTFSMTFSILFRGDSGVTRCYAVDLMMDMLKNENIKQSLSVFDNLGTCIDGVLKLIYSSTAESVVKIFELLLAFCAVEGVRSTICKCILSLTTLEDRGRFMELLSLPVSQITDPLLATVHWASQSVETHDNAPLFALDFLTEFYEEFIYSGFRAKFSLHAQLLMPMLIETLKITLDVNNAAFKKICIKIVKVLQFLSVLCGEDDIKRKICELLDISILTALLDHQYNSNYVALRSIKSVHNQDWSEQGVDIVIYSLDLMTKLQRQVPKIDALFSTSLQDSRIVPFLSYGLTSHERNRVQVTLNLIAMGSSLDGFPVILLGDAILACNTQKVEEEAMFTYTRKTSCPQQSNPLHRQQNGSYGFENKENIPMLGQRNRVTSDSGFKSQNETAIESILEKWQTGLEIKETKTTEIIEIYEHKLQSLQTKESQLEDLLEAKEMALKQSDRIIAQNRSRHAQYEAEAHKMRALLKESERASEQYREQLNEITLKKESLQNDFDMTVQENRRASEQLSKLQDERKQLSKQLKETETKLEKLSESHKELQSEHKRNEKEREELEEAIDKLRVDMSQAEKLKKQLKHQVASLELVCQKHEADIKEKDTKLEELQTELDKHTQIAALIHSLSSGKSDVSKK
ncbi:hypothetical protein KUTeg_006641 [Tegillarca granosa]|uniref:CIP2A N-terminal domain-containing protein n=1 Tax=Tegillarca granosa TaxID=220873 RepID=A0ABQ9FCY5_TEGGR|nr:hypothetical protein KUTeg_006641 [Tegillarca granosa]